jgi:hypothetical protein
VVRPDRRGAHPVQKRSWSSCCGNGPQGPARSGTGKSLSGNSRPPWVTTVAGNGYPAILVRLDRIGVPELDELITEAWLKQAPKRLAAEYLKTR